MARLKNITGADLAAYKPAEEPGSVLVPAGQMLEVRGNVVEQEDAYLVGTGADARLFPKAVWQLVKEAERPSSRTAS